MRVSNNVSIARAVSDIVSTTYIVSDIVSTTQYEVCCISPCCSFEETVYFCGIYPKPKTVTCRNDTSLYNSRRHDPKAMPYPQNIKLLSYDCHIYSAGAFFSRSASRTSPGTLPRKHSMKNQHSSHGQPSCSSFSSGRNRSAPHTAPHSSSHARYSW